MAYTTMNISLPKRLKSLVDSEVERGGYGTASEYIREAVRAAIRRRTVERLEVLALEGLATPERVLGAADWRTLRARARRADRDAKRR